MPQKKCLLQAIFSKGTELLINALNKTSFPRVWVCARVGERRFRVYKWWSNRWPKSQTETDKTRGRRLNAQEPGDSHKSQRSCFNSTFPPKVWFHQRGMCLSIQTIWLSRGPRIIMFMGWRWHKMWGRYIGSLLRWWELTRWKQQHITTTAWLLNFMLFLLKYEAGGADMLRHIISGRSIFSGSQEFPEIQEKYWQNGWLQKSKYTVSTFWRRDRTYKYGQFEIFSPVFKEGDAGLTRAN